MYRQNGKKALNIFIKNKNRCRQIENSIHENCQNQEDYKLIIQEVINLFRSDNNIDFIQKKILNKDYLFNTNEYKNFKKKLEEMDNFLMKPFEVDEGVLTCNKCNSNKTFSYTKQTRSGDESTTVFVVCSNCNAKWKIYSLKKNYIYKKWK